MTLAGLERCPQCSVAKPMLTHETQYYEPYSGKSNLKGWVIYRCTSCNNFVAARGNFNTNFLNANYKDIIRQSNIDVLELIPKSRSLDSDLPERPDNYLSQALMSLAAPDGAIMLAGSAVDAMLKVKGYIEGSLYDRINKAAEDHLITADMAEWAHAVRLESNKPRHADIEDPHASQDDAKRTIAFAEAMGEFLFVLPARVDRGRKAASEADS
jgi:hypothetical protein